MAGCVILAESGYLSSEGSSFSAEDNPASALDLAECSKSDTSSERLFASPTTLVSLEHELVLKSEEIRVLRTEVITRDIKIGKMQKQINLCLERITALEETVDDLSKHVDSHPPRMKNDRDYHPDYPHPQRDPMRLPRHFDGPPFNPPPFQHHSHPRPPFDHPFPEDRRRPFIKEHREEDHHRSLYEFPPHINNSHPPRMNDFHSDMIVDPRFRRTPPPPPVMDEQLRVTDLTHEEDTKMPIAMKPTDVTETVTATTLTAISHDKSHSRSISPDRPFEVLPQGIVEMTASRSGMIRYECRPCRKYGMTTRNVNHHCNTESHLKQLEDWDPRSVSVSGSKAKKSSKKSSKKRLTVGKKKVTVEQQQQQEHQHQQSELRVVGIPGSSRFCRECQKSVPNGGMNWTMHCNGKLHRANVERLLSMKEDSSSEMRTTMVTLVQKKKTIKDIEQHSIKKQESQKMTTSSMSISMMDEKRDDGVNGKENKPLTLNEDDSSIMVLPSVCIIRNREVLAGILIEEADEMKKRTLAISLQKHLSEEDPNRGLIVLFFSSLDDCNHGLKRIEDQMAGVEVRTIQLSEDEADFIEEMEYDHWSFLFDRQ